MTLAVILILFKVDARLCQQIYRILRIHIIASYQPQREKKDLLERKLEIELPRSMRVSMLVGKRDAQLDDFEQIDVASKSLVVIV